MKSDDAFYDCDCGGSLISEKSCRILLLHFVYMVQVLRTCTRGGLRVKPAVYYDFNLCQRLGSYSTIRQDTVGQYGQ